MTENSKRSLVTRVTERFRYGLAAQETLDSLHRWLRIIVCPYFVVAEGLGTDFAPGDEGTPTYRIRFLEEGEMGLVHESSLERHSVANLKQLLKLGNCLGIFVDDRLVGHTWSRTDYVPVPNSDTPLFKLADDEAYLFNAAISRDLRGNRLAQILRYQLYEELNQVGRGRLYSISLAFNRSSRRFKDRLGAKETELRVLLGIARWRGVDLRLFKFDDRVRSPRLHYLNLARRSGQSN